MTTRKIERLVDKLEFYQDEREEWESRLERSLVNMPNDTDEHEHCRAEILRYSEIEKKLSQLIIELEDCEHLNSEDTGGPDGSRECLDCGKEW